MQPPSKSTKGANLRTWLIDTVDRLIDCLTVMRLRPGPGIAIKETPAGTIISVSGQMALPPRVNSTTAAAPVSGGGYNGPFKTSVSGSSISVAGGRMYLGGTECTVGPFTLTSSNGTVYYYVFNSGGSYYSGCSVAASASALGSAICGQQGFFTALANVQGGTATQVHYGNIRIDGRWL